MKPEAFALKNPGGWREKRVLVTGHTGFKGGWLALWLRRLGATVLGIGLPPDTQPSFAELVGVSNIVDSQTLDIRELDKLKQTVVDFDPDIVFHLAAEALVHRAYNDPVETFTTNVMGTWNLLEACRACPRLGVVVVVTTDKVYENHEWIWPYRECDRLGGEDPYSASKVAAEIVTLAYNKSYFAERGVPVLTARGGNVIGGGDWAANRLVPDLFRTIQDGKRMRIRSPGSVRPWQHVLVLCHGYLALAEAAVTGRLDGEHAWNFGPDQGDCVSVTDLLDMFRKAGVAFEYTLDNEEWKPEARFLSLDSSRARRQLGWRPALGLEKAVAWTADWYRAGFRQEDMEAVSVSQIEAYASRIGSGD